MTIKLKSAVCIGYGEFAGKCLNTPGTPWTPHWCERCDKLRRDHITKQLEGMLAEMKKKSEAQP